MSLVDFSSPSLLKRFRVLTFFITTRCNARCETCFYWQSLNDPKLKELSLEEIDALAQTMPPFPHLLLSGGEPAMRKELVQIVEIFIKRNKIITIDCPTNGLTMERTVENVEYLLDKYPDLIVTIGNSIDGLGETHDRLRGVAGNFEKSQATIQALCELRQRRISEFEAGRGPFPRMQIVTLTTVNNQNLDEVETLARDFSERYDLDTMMFEALRPMSKDPTLRAPSPEQHDRVVRMSMEINRKLWARRWESDRATKLSYLRGIYRMQRQVLEGKRLPVNCQAGISLGVLEPDGRVRFCELLDVVGNVRESGLDWNKVWMGDAAIAQRKWIYESRCTCSHCVNLGHTIDSDWKTRTVRKMDAAAFALMS